MVSVLVGPNRFALLQAVEKEKQDFSSKHGSLAVESIDGEEAEFADVSSAVQSVSLFTPKKLVILKSPGENKQLSEKINEIVGITPDETQLIITEPVPDKRSTYFKTLKESTTLKEFKVLDETSLVKWLLQEASAKDALLTASDARYLINRIGSDQNRLYSELIKLTDHSSQISKAEIDDLTEPNPQNTVFELLDAAFSGNLKRTLQLYENLRTGGSQPQFILGMLAWQMHQVALVISTDKPVDEVAKDSGLKSFPLQKSRKIAQRLSTQKVKELLQKLTTFDKAIKTRSTDIDDALKNILSEVAISS